MTFLSPEGTIMIALIMEELVRRNVSTYAHCLLSSSISKKTCRTSFFFSNTLGKAKRCHFFHPIIPPHPMSAKTSFSMAFCPFLGHRKRHVDRCGVFLFGNRQFDGKSVESAGPDPFSFHCGLGFHTTSSNRSKTHGLNQGVITSLRRYIHDKYI